MPIYQVITKYRKSVNGILHRIWHIDAGLQESEQSSCLQFELFYFKTIKNTNI